MTLMFYQKGWLDNMNFQTYLNSAANQIEKTIQQYLIEWNKEVYKISPKLTPLMDIFVDAWQGGKRLRGTLVKLGYEMAAKKTNPEILQVATAYEIFQTSILTHDDIIDRSPIRRGKPTLYRQLGGDHYGISQTICLGDIGFFLAIKLIIDSKFDDKVKTKATNAFSKMVINTGLGEMLDIELPHLQDIREETDVLAIHRLKTAYYTISYPLITGALIGGATKNQVDLMEKLGEKLGIAFQIQDDILGIFGDEKTLGKSLYSDIEEGKNTLLITYALEHADKKQSKALNLYYGVGPIKPNQLDSIKQIFIDTGALDYSKQKALKYVSEAKKIIPKISSDPKYQRLLEQMADFLVERSK